MILDASAVVAILLREPGYLDLLEAIRTAPKVAIGAPTLVESSMVVTARLGPHSRDLAATMMREGGIDVLPFSEDHSSQSQLRRLHGLCSRLLGRPPSPFPW